MAEKTVRVCDPCEKVVDTVRFRVSVDGIDASGAHLTATPPIEVDLCPKGVARLGHFITRGTRKVGWKPEKA